MRVGAIVVALVVAGLLLAQSQPPSKQYVVLLKRGPKWVPGKPAGEQELRNHGRYLQEQMKKGTLQLAGPFLDDSGGLVLYNARDEAEVRAIAGHDPGVVNGILAVESIRPFHLAFDAASGTSPFSAALAIAWSASMSAMPGMPMPGGWTMSMVWMRMPGQTWPGAAASFVGMWAVMMIAMMLPSFAPMLLRYRQAVRSTDETRLAPLTALVSLGYFFVWTLFGLALFPLGIALAALEMELPELARAIPATTAVVVLTAGALQFTAWKARHLACCREAPGRTLCAGFGTAWREGVRFALHCGLSCANLTAILLVAGLMDPRAMAVVTAAITAERLAPAGEWVARAIGAIAVGAGFLLFVRAAGLG